MTQKTPTAVMLEQAWSALILSRLLPLVAELGIADLVAAGPRRIEDLAAATGTNADGLGRCLRALASAGIFADDGTGAYVNTALSESLRENAPLTARAAVRLTGLPFLTRAWDMLPDLVRGSGNQSAWELGNGVPPFEYLAGHPEEAAVFQQAMSAFSGPEAQAIVAAFDFSQIDTLVDVGGGHGQLLAAVLAATPTLSGVLFELPFVADGARNLLAERGVADRCQVVTGDFFVHSVPAGDAHLMKNILHDFDDQHALEILRNCRRAVAPGGRVLVVQEALPAGNAESFGKLLDIQMLLIGGRERTEDEYRELLASAGYELTRVVPTTTPLHVIEGIAH